MKMSALTHEEGDACRLRHHEGIRGQTDDGAIGGSGRDRERVGVGNAADPFDGRPFVRGRFGGTVGDAEALFRRAGHFAMSQAPFVRSTLGDEFARPEDERAATAELNIHRAPPAARLQRRRQVRVDVVRHHGRIANATMGRPSVRPDGQPASDERSRRNCRI